MEIKRATTSLTIPLFAQDTTSSVGAGKTGLLFSSFSFCYYKRELGSAGVAITLATMTLGTWATGGFKELDATHMPGSYDFGVPNAAIDNSDASKWVEIYFLGASGAFIAPIRIDLILMDKQDSVRAGLTALPNAAAGANGGLPLGDASGRVDLSKINGDTLSPLAMVDYFAQAVRGTVQAYTSNLVTLESGASSVDNYYRGMTIYITSGPGARQYAEIVAYTGSTRVAQTVGPWPTSPTTSSTYMILPTGAANVVSWYFGGVAAPSAAGYIGADVEQWKGATAPAMTGDAFARLGAPAGASVSVDVASIKTDAGTLLGRLTALRAGYLDVLNGIVAAIWAAVVDSAGVTTLLARLGVPVGASISADIAAVKVDTAAVSSRLTSARAGYLDNLNVGGAVASQADINALNQSASRRIILASVGQFERPETGTVTYTVEARTYDEDGAAVNADTTPTLTATGIVTGSLAGNLSAATNPATGVYRWTYTVNSTDAAEQVRFDISAVLNSATFTLTQYAQVVDLVSATWTATDATHLTSIFNKLPSKSYIAGTNNSDGDIQEDEMTGGLSATAKAHVNTEVDTALADYDGPTHAELSAELATLQSHGDTAWATMTAAALRSALGLVSANLDAQLTAIDDYLDTEVAAIKAKTDNLPVDPADASDIAAFFATVISALGFIDDFVDTEIAAILAAVDTEVAAIKAKTDNLPASPASTGDVTGSTAAIEAYGDIHWPTADVSDLPTNAELTAAVAPVKTVTDKLGGMIEHHLTYDRFTDNALEEAPTGSGGGGGGATAEDMWTWPDRTLTQYVPVTLIQPIDPDTLEISIIAGDSYLEAMTPSRPIDWVDGGNWPDLTDAVIKIFVHNRNVSGQTVNFEVVLIALSNPQRIRLELLSAQTARFSSKDNYDYRVVAVLADVGNPVVTLAYGNWTVIDV